MSYVKYTDFPKVNDTIGFTIETYDGNGVLCNPYTVEKITIYYVEKTNTSDRVHYIKHYNPELERVYNDLQNSEQSNNNDLISLKKTMEETAVIDSFYYSDTRIVTQTKGQAFNPELNIKNIVNLVDDKNNPIMGKFLFLWKPKNVREGTYFIRWDWKNEKGKKIWSAEKLFTLAPAEERINSIYSKFVPREKYNILFDRYIPKMYRVKTSPNDITPEVMVKLNRAVAQSMLELDDLAVGLADLLSPTFIPEGFLPVMANFFNIELRSKSSNAWRNQIKHAIPLFKKKGTISGLRESLDKAGIKLLKLTNLWQVISPYTWVDGFVIEKDIGSNSEIIGYLSKKPIDKDI